MALMSDLLEGWTLNLTHRRGAYRVELVGPYKLPQVCDMSGAAALSGPSGEVFQRSVEQAQQLCAMASEGRLRG